MCGQSKKFRHTTIQVSKTRYCTCNHLWSVRTPWPTSCQGLLHSSPLFSDPSSTPPRHLCPQRLSSPWPWLSPLCPRSWTGMLQCAPLQRCFVTSVFPHDHPNGLVCHSSLTIVLHCFIQGDIRGEGGGRRQQDEARGGPRSTRRGSPVLTTMCLCGFGMLLPWPVACCDTVAPSNVRQTVRLKLGHQRIMDNFAPINFFRCNLKQVRHPEYFQTTPRTIPHSANLGTLSSILNIEKLHYFKTCKLFCCLKLEQLSNCVFLQRLAFFGCNPNKSNSRNTFNRFLTWCSTGQIWERWAQFQRVEKSAAAKNCSCFATCSTETIKHHFFV